MNLNLRATVVAGATAGLLAGGLVGTASAENECDKRGQGSTPVVTDAIHENEATIDLAVRPLGKDTHEDVEPLTCTP